jgi:DNA-directed RNA polymerase subunit RPC12/RpoP
MTRHSMEPDFTSGLSIFEKSCAYCGARFRVLASHGPERDLLPHHEDYACPECGKQYETEALAEPEVWLLHPRSDGKHDRYQETMF